MIDFVLSSEDGGEVQWCFSQVKGTLDEDLTEGKMLTSKSLVKLNGSCQFHTCTFVGEFLYVLYSSVKFWYRVCPLL